MGFENDPSVDESAKRSEESVNAVRGWFTRKRGFILREENPDYGVDFDVELMSDESGASSKKFAIQIKSTANAKKVTYEGTKFLALPFKTSRLGYLCRRPPAYGIIVLYDEKTGNCHYDYVEEIIARLDTPNLREGWRDQETVTILLPPEPLTIDAVVQIHKKITARHLNGLRLLSEYGNRFSIPVLESERQKDKPLFDINNPDEVAQTLEKHGGWLFNSQRFGYVLQLLDKVSRERLENSPNLIFIAAITYTQSGNIIDAEYYIRKAKRLGNLLTEEQRNNIEFSQVKLEFLKGNADRGAILVKLQELADNTSHKENGLVIKINIILFELISGITEDKFDKDFLLKIIGLFRNIEESGLSREKIHLLSVYHSESLQNYAMQINMDKYFDFKLKEKLGREISFEQRLESAKMIISLTNTVATILREAYFFAVENNETLLKATAAHQLAKNFFTQRSSFYMMESGGSTDTDTKTISLCSDYHNLALAAYNQYLELHMYQNAFEAIGIAYDIQKLCYLEFNTLVGQLQPAEILGIIRAIEQEYEFQPFQSGVENLKRYRTENRGGKESLIGVDDEQIKAMAKRLLKALDLTENRLDNIIHSLKTIRAFAERCSNPDIELLENELHRKHISTYYLVPVTFILRNKKNGEATKPNTDIDKLFSEFAHYL